MNQRFTSATTSINRVKLPAVYGKVSFPAGSVVFDYGCGRYTDHIRQHLSGSKYLPYDVFNQPDDVNSESIRSVTRSIMQGRSVSVVCSNVLNVIDSDDIVRGIMARIARIIRSGHGTAYITVYEGDRSGHGKQTGPDSWQRNARLADYLQFVPVGVSARISRGMIILECMPA